MKYMIANLFLSLLPPTRCFAFKAFVLRCLGVSIDRTSKVCGGVKFYGAGKVSIGQDCWIGLGTAFYTSAAGHVVIGDRCDIAPQVAFMCGTHEIGGRDRRAGKGTASSILVGDGVWIGIRSTLLGGAEIATAAIVGAGSLVLPGIYPNDTLLVGSPARPKKQL
jgi:maltose O-acetyltransferase